MRKTRLRSYLVLDYSTYLIVLECVCAGQLGQLDRPMRVFVELVCYIPTSFSVHYMKWFSKYKRRLKNHTMEHLLNQTHNKYRQDIIYNMYRKL
jgi:hypothetical protein